MPRPTRRSPPWQRTLAPTRTRVSVRTTEESRLAPAAKPSVPARHPYLTASTLQRSRSGSDLQRTAAAGAITRTSCASRRHRDPRIRKYRPDGKARSVPNLVRDPHVATSATGYTAADTGRRRALSTGLNERPSSGRPRARRCPGSARSVGSASRRSVTARSTTSSWSCCSSTRRISIKTRNPVDRVTRARRS